MGWAISQQQVTKHSTWCIALALPVRLDFLQITAVTPPLRVLFCCVDFCSHFQKLDLSQFISLWIWNVPMDMSVTMLYRAKDAWLSLSVQQIFWLLPWCLEFILSPPYSFWSSATLQKKLRFLDRPWVYSPANNYNQAPLTILIQKPYMRGGKTLGIPTRWRINHSKKPCLHP